MKVKVFHIRLTKENLQTDQETINSFMESVVVKKTATVLINGQPNYWTILVFYDDKKPEKTEKTEKISHKISITDEDELTEEEKRIFSALKQWRDDQAAQLNLPKFMVCLNAELMTIAKVQPETVQELLFIKGFGEQKIAKFGEEILLLLHSI